MRNTQYDLKIAKEKFVPGVYAIMTLGNGTYKDVQDIAKKLGIECFVPMQEVRSPIKENPKTTKPVLGKGYAFVALFDSRYLEEFYRSGVVSFLGNNGVPSPLTLQDRARVYGLDRKLNREYLSLGKDISKGDGVVVIDGPLAGIDGVVTSVDSANGKAKMVSDRLFGCEIKYTLPLSLLVREETVRAEKG